MEKEVTLRVYLTSNDVIDIKMDKEDALDKLMDFRSDNPRHDRMTFPGHVIDKKIIGRMSVEKVVKEGSD